LPEAQLDRFLFKIKIDYPNLEQEVSILANAQQREDKDELSDINAVVSGEDIVKYQALAAKVIVEDDLLRYIAQVVDKTRNHSALFLGGSPRASLAILNAAKAYAALEGRDFVTPDDIKVVIVPVLNHRIILTPEKEMEGVRPEVIIQQIIDSVEVPR